MKFQSRVTFYQDRYHMLVANVIQLTDTSFVGIATLHTGDERIIVSQGMIEFCLLTFEEFEAIKKVSFSHYFGKKG